MSIRTRIAPSPTGDPHVGTAYVALFNYALAKKHGGQFLLRVEDTDRQRSNPASERMIFEALRWLGLQWDEGPDVGGPCGPYRQSERSEIYRHHAEMLIASGNAYPCFCTAERLTHLREEQKAAKATVMGYDGLCRTLSPAEARRRRDAGEAHVIRLAMPETESMTVQDLLRGELRFERPQMDDQVLLKSDGFPTYHLANVVDDHLMGISHVLRAEEWLSSLPKHFQLYRAFGWELPVFCHLPLLRNADRSKISKRKNPVSVMHYRRAGFLPEAMLNFLALMSFSMPNEQEEFSLEEFTRAFEMTGISLGGPVFDLEKLTWLNGRYLRRLTTEQMIDRLQQHLLSPAYLGEVIPLCRERIDTLEAFFDYASFFFVGEVKYDPTALAGLIPKGRTSVEVAGVLQAMLEQAIDPLLEWNAATVETAIKEHVAVCGWAPKELFMTVRFAATGRAATPPLFETLAVLGKEVCRRRLRAAAEALRTQK
ncbi:MAG: glutamate--tRNA ligase [Candidatus Eisenbacteria bacterium]|nr:glutamate--tRNA ligase [Candidatus Eisenbacteria bacterium]MCC7140805.1 glutamate--tRNA ligase [Candidatus Eisenbacteria bacterium]